MTDHLRLPPFPVDDSALAMLSAAINPGEDAERSSVSDLLVLYSEMAGSDTNAVDQDDGGVRVMRDPQYHEHDVITALIAEIERLKAEVETVRYVAESNKRHHQELYAEYEKLEAEVERLSDTSLWDGGKWTVDYGRPSRTKPVTIWHSGQRSGRDTVQRRVWRGPVGPIDCCESGSAS